MKRIIGIDIGGTKCAVVLGQYNRASNEISICDKLFVATQSHKGSTYIINNIYSLIEEIIIRNNLTKKEISNIGISCGGPLDSKKGIIMSPPNLPGWDNINIVNMIEDQYSIKTKLQNDANACALAEWKFGAGKGYKDIIFLTFGTGMGAGLILDGRLYNGACCMAGEVGHIRLSDNGPVGYGKSGSFEGFCSGGGIAQLARTKVLEKLQMGESVSFLNGINQIELLTAKLVAQAAYKGDETAIEIFKESGKYLGKGLSILIDILNPEVIIIGSIFSRATDLLWTNAKNIIKEEALSFSRAVCEVVPSKLGDSIGDYAALAVAIS